MLLGQNLFIKLLCFDAAVPEAGKCTSTSQPAMMSVGSTGSMGSNNSGQSSWATVPMSSATRARRNWQRAMKVRTGRGPWPIPGIEKGRLLLPIV